MNKKLLSFTFYTCYSNENRKITTMQTKYQDHFSKKKKKKKKKIIVKNPE